MNTKRKNCLRERELALQLKIKELKLKSPFATEPVAHALLI